MTHQTMYNTFLCLVQSIVNNYFVITVIHFNILIALIILQLYMYTQTQDMSTTARAIIFSIYAIFNRA